MKFLILHVQSTGKPILVNAEAIADISVDVNTVGESAIVRRMDGSLLWVRETQRGVLDAPWVDLQGLRRAHPIPGVD